MGKNYLQNLETMEGQAVMEYTTPKLKTEEDSVTRLKAVPLSLDDGGRESEMWGVEGNGQQESRRRN